MLGRRDNRYITAPELAQVAFLSCFADLEFSSSVHISKVTKKFRMSYCNSVKCQAIFLELALPYFALNKIFVQFLFINSMKLDFLMLSRIALETFCV